MPSPVEALPCGSRSTISTFSPIAASAVPRLIAVVVLPTPPFWLARARTRGLGRPGLRGVSVMRAAPPLPSLRGAPATKQSSFLQQAGLLRFARNDGGLAPTSFHHIQEMPDISTGYCLDVPHPDNSARRIGLAWDQLGLHSPRFRGLGQFGLYILSLRKQPDRSPFQQRNCVADQPVERRQGPRRHDVEALGGGGDKILDSRCVHNGWKRKLRGDGSEEGGLLLYALDQVDLRARRFGNRAGDDESREAPACSEVGPAAGIRGEKKKLKRVGDVARPQPWNR